MNGTRIDRSSSQRTALLRSYVAPEVVAHIMSDGRTPLLSGVRLPVTVLFADIRNFTRLAGTLPAERVVAMLDRYFHAMTAAATAHDAMIDKLIGDAIMLVYGVPQARGDEALRALATADAMHHAFARLLTGWRRLVPRRLRLGLAVGCASGEVVLANVGSAARMDYTIIGAPVNLAARLTDAAAAGVTLVSADVRNAVRAAPTADVRFGPARHLRLKGVRGQVVAHASRLGTPAAAGTTAPAVTDPVCGMKLTARRARRLMHRRRAYYFCSSSCEARFRRDPAVYATS